MNTDENVLSGGNMNQVVRHGGTVHRTVKGHPLLHPYLLYLEQAGMPGVPHFLGIDARGREILTYLPGQTMGPDYPPHHPALCADETVQDMARLMRQLYDTSVDFLPQAIEGGWTNPHFPPEDCETICHNDAAIWNFVFADDRLYGLFDFDTAAPGPRVWDLALSLYSVIPLTAHVPIPELQTSVPYDATQHAAARARRIHLFFGAYGMPCPPDIMAYVIRRGG